MSKRQVWKILGVDKIKIHSSLAYAQTKGFMDYFLQQYITPEYSGKISYKILDTVNSYFCMPCWLQSLHLRVFE